MEQQIDPMVVSMAIKAEAAAVWAALTDGGVSPAYYYGFSVDSDWTEGGDYRYTVGGHDVINGELSEVIADRRLAMSFRGSWDPGVAELPESTVEIDLEDPKMPTPGVTVLTLTHRGLPDVPAARELYSGWVLILSGLKTLLETGSPLVTAPAA